MYICILYISIYRCISIYLYIHYIYRNRDLKGAQTYMCWYTVCENNQISNSDLRRCSLALHPLWLLPDRLHKSIFRSFSRISKFCRILLLILSVWHTERKKSLHIRKKKEVVYPILIVHLSSLQSLLGPDFLLDCASRLGLSCTQVLAC